MSDTDQLKKQAGELVKQHIEYDANGRTEYVYTSRADLANGLSCSVVRYAYVGLTSRVLFMREYLGTWQAAWELF